MATTSTASKRSLIVAIIVAFVSGCTGSAASPPAPAEPTTSSAASVASASPEPVEEVLTGGRYDFRPIPNEPSFSVVATGPDGWYGYPSWAMDGPLPIRADAPTGIGISFFTANGIYSDPCRWDVEGTGSADVGNVGIGSTVDDLVVALRANTFYTSTVAKPVTVDGYEGKKLTLQLPNDPFTSCDAEQGDSDGHAFVFSGAGLYAQGPANIWDLYILDVDGTRLISVILSYAKTPKADLAIARDVIESLDIEP